MSITSVKYACAQGNLMSVRSAPMSNVTLFVNFNAVICKIYVWILRYTLCDAYVLEISALIYSCTTLLRVAVE